MSSPRVPRLSWPERRVPVAAPVELAEDSASTGGDAPNGEHLLIAGDNLAVLGALAPTLAGQVTLAYLDPPFFTGREHTLVSRSRGPGGVARTLGRGFDDRWPDLATYLEALEARLRAVHPLLAPHGSVVLHVDPKTSHYARVLADEVFGAECFASEIVWRYRRWPAKTPNFQRVHDVLLRYVRDATARPRFRQRYEALAASTVATWGRAQQRAVVDAGGRRRRSSTTDAPSPGAPLGDVWEIGIVAPVARERTGYPTQKPEALLARLVDTLTDEGELVLDPYCGSGTTAAVAARMGRRSVTIDDNPAALAIAAARLEAQGARPRRLRAEPPERARAPRRLAG